MITIVLPVHNGGALLRRCIESLAKQDSAPGSFELVILDNHSTDGALEALHILPGDIPRRVIGSERLLPIEQNWARILEVPSAREFITTIGHDDALDPGFIRTMSRVLQESPTIRLLFAHFRLIDENDGVIRPCLPMSTWESAGQFLAGRLTHIRDSFGTGYVTRFADYREAGGIPPYAKLLYADDALWLKLAQPSGIHILEEQLFSYRLHTTSTAHTRDAAVWLDAFSKYVEYLETSSASDPGVRRALTTYGPGYAKALALHRMTLEATNANTANEPARADVIAGWRALYRRVSKLAGKAEPFHDEPDELAFSLWANEHALTRQLYARRAGRAMLRRLRKATRSRAT